MRVNDFYQTESKWLKAGDLNKRKVRVTIEKAEVVEFKDGSKKLALLFKGKEKGLVLNKTNAQLIAEQHGDEIRDWSGKEIAIYPTTTDFGGERVDCIRVEQFVPEAEEDQDF